MDNNIIEIVLNLYENCTPMYKCCNISTEFILIRKGVRQGCPLSMLLFNIVMNPVLEEIDRISVGVTLANVRLTVFAYADDIAILSRTRPILSSDGVVWISRISNAVFLAFQMIRKQLIS